MTAIDLIQAAISAGTALVTQLGVVGTAQANVDAKTALVAQANSELNALENSLTEAHSSAVPLRQAYDAALDAAAIVVPASPAPAAGGTAA